MTFSGRRKSVLALLLAALAACGFTSGPAMAQGGATGALTGTVLDPTGGGIPDASIRIIDTATGQAARSVTTNSLGSFTAALLPPGNYVVIVNAAGFGEGRIGAARARVTQTTTLVVTLKPSAGSGKVEVSPAGVPVHTPNTTTRHANEKQDIKR